MDLSTKTDGIKIGNIQIQYYCSGHCNIPLSATDRMCTDKTSKYMEDLNNIFN